MKVRIFPLLQIYGCVIQFGLEYLSDTQEVGGSSPSTPTNAPIYANWSGSHPLKVEIRVRVSLGVQKIFQIYLYNKNIFVIFVLLVH